MSKRETDLKEPLVDMFWINSSKQKKKKWCLGAFLNSSNDFLVIINLNEGN